jgi:hypothetical protein
MLDEAFSFHAKNLPLLFDPKAPAVALRPSVAALKKCIALLSGTESVNGNGPATDEVFAAPDALGWAYQYWNTEEKDRVFEKVRTKKAKIQGRTSSPRPSSTPSRIWSSSWSRTRSAPPDGDVPGL